MGNIKMSNKFLAVLCLICAIILEGASMLQSGEFFYSSADGFWGAVLVTIGGVLDIGQIICPALTVICYNRCKFLGIMFFGTLSIVAVVYSFGTSMGFNINKNNEIINETVTNSDAYKRQTQVFNTTSSSVESLKKDILNLKESRSKKEEQIRSDYAPLIATAKKMDYITTPKQNGKEVSTTGLTAERDEKIKSLDDDIKSKEAELKEKETSLLTVNNNFSTVGTNIKSTKGIMGLATWIDPINAENMAGTLNMIKEIMVCVFGVAFSLGFGILIEKEGDFAFPTFSNHSNDYTITDPKEIEFIKNHREKLSPSPSPVIAKTNIEDYPNKLNLGQSDKLNNFVPDGLNSKVIKGFQFDPPYSSVPKKSDEKLEEKIYNQHLRVEEKPTFNISKIDLEKSGLDDEDVQKWLNSMHMTKEIDKETGKPTGVIAGYQSIGKKAFKKDKDDKENYDSLSREILGFLKKKKYLSLDPEINRHVINKIYNKSKT